MKEKNRTGLCDSGFFIIRAGLQDSESYFAERRGLLFFIFYKGRVSQDQSWRGNTRAIRGFQSVTQF